MSPHDDPVAMAAQAGHVFIPGTVHLVDMEGTMHAQHARGGKHDIVLVPKPSDDPDDPLNWSPRRKLLFQFCLCTYTLTVGIASAAIYSILVPISEVTSLTVDNLNAGTGYMFLAFGWGCLIWQPFAQKCGKRPAYLLSLLGTMAVMIWAPHTKTNGQWIGNKVVQGLLGAPIESLCEISVSDVYFTHERGTYIGVYALFLAGSNFLAPVMSGFINDGQGWSWVLYWCAIFTAAGFVICFFLMEETNYQRKAIVEDDSESDDVGSVPAGGEKKSSAASDSEKGMAGLPSSSAEEARSVPEGANNHLSTGLYKKKNYFDKIKVLQFKAIKERKVAMKGLFVRPLIFASFPVIFYCGFMYGASVCFFNVLNGTASMILSGEPYNFRASIVGLSYVSCVIGVCVGSFYSGPVGDRFVLWMARRNNGVMEPEHRLWLYSLSLVTFPAFLILWGVGAAHGVHWFGLIFAMGVIACANTVGCQLPISYCIDSYKDLGADAMVTVILVRNTMSFAVSYGITPWVTNMGFQNAFIVAAFASFAQLATFLYFVKFGRGLRLKSVPRFLKYVQQIKDDGLLH